MTDALASLAQSMRCDPLLRGILAACGEAGRGVGPPSAEKEYLAHLSFGQAPFVRSLSDLGGDVSEFPVLEDMPS